MWCSKRVVSGVALIAAALWLAVPVANAQWSAKLIAVPKVNIRVHLGNSSRAELMDVIHKYAQREHFKIIDGGGGLTDSEGQPLINILLVRDDGVRVGLLGIDVNRLGFSIAIYAGKKNDAWSLAARQLISDLRAHWPKAIEVSYPETGNKHPANVAWNGKAFMRVRLGEDTVAQFAAVIREYAKREGFQVINEFTAVDVNGQPMLGLKLVRKDGVIIEVQGIDIDIRGYDVIVDAKKNSASWRLATKQLVDVLQSKWPNTVTVEYPPGAF